MRHIAAVFVLVLLGGIARADEPRELARQHFMAAEAHLQAGRHDEAIAEYRRAYAYVPSPAFLYNIAQAYRQKGDAASALTYYRRYLEADPRGRAAAAAREHAAAMEELVRARAAEPEVTAPPPEPAPAPPPAPAPAPPAPVPVAPRPSAPARHDGGSGLRIAGLVAGGAGVAAIGAGVYFGIRARNLSDQVSGTFEPEDDASGKAANRNMLIGYGVGAAGLITGGVISYLAARARSEVVPVVSFGRDRIQLTWVY
jgi:tetratricopeptide (TPR) repeat protein